MNSLKEIQLFLLDMDGTLNFEEELIPGAQAFINTLVAHQKKYIYLTNNSSKNRQEYILKMRKLGLTCNDDQVFTSGMAMGLFLTNSRPGKRIYLVGTKALEQELTSYGIVITEQDPDIVVVGYDRELNYQKLEKACNFLCNGAEFLATNVDKVCPIRNNRYLPDCGSICDMLEVATKVKAHYIGKPNREMIDILASLYHLDNNQVAMVGDRLYTDMMTAVNAGAKSILVLSGETTLADVTKSTIKPDYIFSSVAELKDYIE